MPCFQLLVNLIMEIWSLHLENIFDGLFFPFLSFRSGPPKAGTCLQLQECKTELSLLHEIKKKWTPIHISSFKALFVCFSKEIFRWMSDRFLGWLLHSPCHGIRRVCVVAFGPETKNLVAWNQEKEERITSRRKKWLGQARKREVGAKPEPALRHNWDSEKPRDSWSGAHCGWVGVQQCWTREACALPPAPPAPSTLAQGSQNGKRNMLEILWRYLIEFEWRWQVMGCQGFHWHLKWRAGTWFWDVVDFSSLDKEQGGLWGGSSLRLVGELVRGSSGAILLTVKSNATR